MDILGMELDLARNRGMNEVILGCYNDNTGSVKAIKGNGGLLYKETTMDDKPTVYYKIKL